MRDKPSSPGDPLHRSSLPALALGAVGVVFGDIGTSPLYTLQVAADAHPDHQLSRADVFGCISLILWALTLAVSVKYVGFVMRADNQGEGGILALLSLLPKRDPKASLSLIALLVVAGAALLFGDGMITPAISVLSAIEGLELAAPGVDRLVVPITCAVLIGLFAIQRHGTSVVGRLFGPVMVAWFAVLAALGANQIVRDPSILGALSPHWGALYFVHHGLQGLAILGVVVLAITGGEALYADMGHFGSPAIRLSWFTLVFPALALAYLGQGALVLRDPSALAHPFFAMAPSGSPFFSYALVGLAALATAIASQALISGVFSLTHQAVQLGLFPRVRIRHTSSEAEGQIYVPLINWGLMVACVVLVIHFKESARLASAYGLAVSGTMAITSVVFFDVTRKTWRWPLAASVAVLALFLSFDVPFFAANLTKFMDGGYIPVVVGAAFFVMMVNWHFGRACLRRYMAEHSSSLDELRSMLASPKVIRVPGVAIYLTANEGAPFSLTMQVTRLRSVMENVILLSVAVEHQPEADPKRRLQVTPFDEHGIARIVLRFGYMETLHVPTALAEALAAHDMKVDLDDAVYYVGRETLLAGKGGRMGPLSESLFALLARNARSAIDHFGLPPERVVELGTRIDL